MRFLPAGPHALLVEVDDLDAAIALHAEVERRRADGWWPALVDVIPGARTVLFDGLDDPEALADELATWSVPPAPVSTAAPVEIPCHYRGPDLSFVAGQWGVADAEVAQIHTAIVHRVAFCGFGPGFAYIAGLGERYAVPRRSEPRTSVPAGSVAVAGVYTGIYPRPTPGGWQLIGSTDVVLWDPGRRPAALLGPGRPVRFVEVDG